MNDQNQPNQPKLSLDEELDVLEAVYKIGKEKGLDLLRPEQVKKLVDYQRVVVKEKVDGKVVKELTDKQKMDIAKKTTKMLVAQVSLAVEKFTQSKMTNEEMRPLIRLMFVMIFETTPEQYVLNVYRGIGGTLGGLS